MGTKLVVKAWVRARWPGNADEPKYEWSFEYEGQNWIKAIVRMIRAKRRGAGCVTIEWR